MGPKRGVCETGAHPERGLLLHGWGPAPLHSFQRSGNSLGASGYNKMSLPRVPVALDFGISMSMDIGGQGGTGKVARGMSVCSADTGRRPQVKSGQVKSCINIYIYIYTHRCIYIYIYTHTLIYIYIYIHTHM